MTTHSTNQSADESPGVSHDATDARSKPNVGRWERAASTALGGTLLVRALRRRSLGGAAAAIAGGALVSRGLRGHSRLYRRLGVDTAGGSERLNTGARARGPSIESSITVGKPADELGEFWRDPEQLNRIVGEFAEVSGTDEHRHRWRARGPFDWNIEWETQLVEDRDDRLRWETLEGAVVPHEATVEFQPAPADRGTEVTLQVQYDPPGGSVGDAVMDRLGVVPKTVVGMALRRFKSLAETGEIPTLEGNPSARGKGDLV